MLSFIKGTIAEIGADYVVLENHGIGYLIYTPASVLDGLPSRGESVQMHTYMYVREDQLALYGFLTRDDLQIFKLLIGVSGVGPKVGLAILSQLTPEDVALAAAAGDAKRFTKASGVGQKLAQRIVLELKDKVKDLSGAAPVAGMPEPGGPSASGNASQAVGALVALGYSASEAAAAVGRLDSALPPEELIRLALKSFGSGK